MSPNSDDTGKEIEKESLERAKAEYQKAIVLDNATLRFICSFEEGTAQVSHFHWYSASDSSGRWRAKVVHTEYLHSEPTWLATEWTKISFV